jgi:PTH1 family peptidyl-tRNA hydrolase
VLLKPMTYMNLSGRAVQSVMSFYKIVVNDVIVVHDELDLELGFAQAREGRVRHCGF